MKKVISALIYLGPDVSVARPTLSCHFGKGGVALEEAERQMADIAKGRGYGPGEYTTRLQVVIDNGGDTEPV